MQYCSCIGLRPILCDQTMIVYLQDVAVEGKVARVAGYAMEPMKLSLAGFIEPAL